MKRGFKALLFTVLVFSIVLAGCGNKKQAKAEKELLVYCGITMINPMSDIARIIERQEDCKIIITKGGSGNLFKSLKINKVGDLYLPGSDSYIKTCLNEGLVTDTVYVGCNKAAIMVQKGNPKNLFPRLDNFTREDLYVVIGNPNSGSIGKETKIIFKKKGIFEDVVNNARKLTTDSKDLINVLKNKEADLVVNWYATSTWENNKDYVDVLLIDKKYAKEKKLVLGLLKTSRYPEIAREFMKYAASDKGREIFTKYGLN